LDATRRKRKPPLLSFYSSNFPAMVCPFVVTVLEPYRREGTSRILFRLVKMSSMREESRADGHASIGSAHARRWKGLT
jgi:hypothetical protein